MIEVDKNNFETEVLQTDGLVVVDFSSIKCEACQELMPAVEEIASRYEGKAKFCKLDAAVNRRLSISQKVLGLPTIAFYKNGQKVDELVKDDATTEAIEQKLKELL